MLWRASQIIAIALILLFWGRSLWQNGQSLLDYQWHFRPLYMIVSMVILLVHISLLAQIWRWTLGYLGARRPWQEATRIWALSQIGRYLPGGVWDVVGRLVLSSQAGYSRTLVSMSVLLEMVLQTISAIFVFLISLLFWEDTTVARSALWLTPLLPLGLIALYPPLLTTCLRALGKITRRDINLPTLRARDIYVLFLMHTGARLLIGTGFYLFVLSVVPWSVAGWPISIGIFAAAWVVGFVIVVIPMGLGVREGIMTLLLSAHIPLAPATVVAIGFRIWLALRDIAFAGLGWILTRTSSTSNKEIHSTSQAPSPLSKDHHSAN